MALCIRDMATVRRLCHARESRPVPRGRHREWNETGSSLCGYTGATDPWRCPNHRTVLQDFNTTSGRTQGNDDDDNNDDDVYIYSFYWTRSHIITTYHLYKLADKLY